MRLVPVLVILLALWATSYPRVVRALRVRLWKPLHGLAFVAALLALQHALLAPMGEKAWVLALLGVFGLGIVVRAALAWPRRRPPQRKATPPRSDSQALS